MNTSSAMNHSDFQANCYTWEIKYTGYRIPFKFRIPGGCKWFLAHIKQKY